MPRKTAVLLLLAIFPGCFDLPGISKRIRYATLLSRDRHGDFEKATISFEHGVRDDPGSRLTHNDWDLQYGNGGDFFDVSMVTDDRSRLLDLGELEWYELNTDKLPILYPYTRPQREMELPAVEGHVYTVTRRTGIPT